MQQGLLHPCVHAILVEDVRRGHPQPPRRDQGRSGHAGSIAEGFYGVPDELRAECLKRLPEDLLDIVERFESCIAR